MTGYTPRALRQIKALRGHFEKRERIEAIRSLDTALYDAERNIDPNPAAGLPAPRPYPHLVQRGRTWLKSGRYWIAFSTTPPPVIVAVFYEMANVPGRL